MNGYFSGAGWVLVLAIPFGVSAHSASAEEPAAVEKKAPRSLGDLRRDLLTWQKALTPFNGEIKPELFPSRRAAIDGLKSLDDPRAVPLIKAIWEKERSDEVREFFIKALQNITDRKALMLMAEISIEERNPSLRQQAAIWISLHEDRDDTIPIFVKYLKTDKFHHAALASLGYSMITKEPKGPPDRDLVAALVAKLVTVTPVKRHVLVSYDTGLYPSRRIVGNIARSWGSEWVWVTEYVSTENPAVKDMLYQYTYQDFGYDRAAWRKYLIQLPKAVPEQRGDQ